ncbi:hypothetical protein ACRRTK_014630 [Alexandromys fortis]
MLLRSGACDWHLPPPERVGEGSCCIRRSVSQRPRNSGIRFSEAEGQAATAAHRGPRGRIGRPCSGPEAITSRVPCAASVRRPV